jgi:chromosome segregation ATPase
MHAQTHTHTQVATLQTSNAALQVEADEATSVLRDKIRSLEKTEKHIKVVIQQALGKDKEIKEQAEELERNALKLATLAAQRDCGVQEVEKLQREVEQLQSRLDASHISGHASASDGGEGGSQLQWQSREAMLKKEKQEQVRAQEQQVSLHQLALQASKAEAGKLQEALDKALASAAEANTQVALLQVAGESEAAGVREQLVACKAAMLELQRRLDAVKPERQAAEARMKEADDALQDALLRAARAEETAARLGAEVKQAQERARSLRVQVQTLEDALALERNKVQEQLAALDHVESAVNQVKRENDMLLQERQQRHGDTAVASERMQHLQHALDASGRLEASQQVLIEDLQKQLQQRQQQLINHRESDESTRNRLLAQQVESKTAELERVNAQLERTRAQLDTRTQERDALRLDLHVARQESQRAAIEAKEIASQQLELQHIRRSQSAMGMQQSQARILKSALYSDFLL